MTRRLRTLLAFAVLALAASARAAETPIPPAPTRWVTDEVGFLSPSTRTSLDSRLAAYERASGNQIIVYVGRSTGDTPVEDWAVRAFEKWGVGRKGLDDGAVLFIFPQDRKARIEVGYGLEPEVPDLTASRILNEVLIPGIRAGRNDEAVTAAAESLVAAASGKPLPQAPSGYARGPQPRPIQGGQLIILMIVGGLFLFFFITNPRLAMLLLWSMMSGGHRRGGGGWGGGGGGGGFSGGGGRSGGGGASGGW